MNFIKGTNIYKTLSSNAAKRKEEKLEKMVSMTEELNQRGIQSQKSFFDSVRSEVNDNPTYRTDRTDLSNSQPVKNIVK